MLAKLDLPVNRDLTSAHSQTSLSASSAGAARANAAMAMGRKNWVFIVIRFDVIIAAEMNRAGIGGDGLLRKGLSYEKQNLISGEGSILYRPTLL